MTNSPGRDCSATRSKNAQAEFIERIDFEGNRRIRSDTLQARIFSREGDPYNEETLRRDFQALWNTQFFEDVKLRVEDSPDKPNGKIIIFEVKERPVIRRIRYDGIKSVSESDILDRFKEKKVGLDGGKPIRSDTHQESGSRAEGSARRTRPTIRDGNAAIRTHRFQQRRHPGFQDQ